MLATDSPPVRKCTNLRLAVHSASSAQRLATEYPAATVMQADLAKAEDAQRILSGVTTVLYIGPSFHIHETQLGYTMVDAACRESQVGNLKHFVYSSVLHPRIRKLLNHDCKRYVEEYLVESGLNYTIVQPKSYPGSVSGGNAVAIRKSRLPCSVQPAGYILIHGFARSG